MLCDVSKEGTVLPVPSFLTILSKGAVMKRCVSVLMYMNRRSMMKVVVAQQCVTSGQTKLFRLMNLLSMR